MLNEALNNQLLDDKIDKTSNSKGIKLYWCASLVLLTNMELCSYNDGWIRYIDIVLMSVGDRL